MWLKNRNDTKADFPLLGKLYRLVRLFNITQDAEAVGLEIGYRNGHLRSNMPIPWRYVKSLRKGEVEEKDET
jgi:hypothetical protein